MKIVLIGAPGSGKGTQSPFMKERYGICHLSTGDALRDAVDRRTPNGILVEKEMRTGGLVPDDIVFGIVKESIQRPECRYGYILDGFPKTEAQAKMLEDSGEKIDRAIALTAPDEVILSRTSGRWTHKGSGRSYHEIFRPPVVPGKDDVTGEPLYQREDDRRDLCEKRLHLYKSKMAPILKFYQDRQTLSIIQANRAVEAVSSSIQAVLDPIAISLGLKKRA